MVDCYRSLKVEWLEWVLAPDFGLVIRKVAVGPVTNLLLTLPFELNSRYAPIQYEKYWLLDMSNSEKEMRCLSTNM